MLNRNLIFSKEKSLFVFNDYKLDSFKTEDLYKLPLVSTLGFNYFPFYFQKNLIFFNTFIFLNPNFHQNSVGLNSLLTKLLKIFLKGLSQGFFCEFRIFGLGFKVKKSSYKTGHSLKFDLGYSHILRIELPHNIKFFRVKRRFLLFSNDYFILTIFKKHIYNFRLLNPYKLRGLKLTGMVYKSKQGKKQNKR